MAYFGLNLKQAISSNTNYNFQNCALRLRRYKAALLFAAIRVTETSL